MLLLLLLLLIARHATLGAAFVFSWFSFSSVGNEKKGEKNGKKKNSKIFGSFLLAWMRGSRFFFFIINKTKMPPNLFETHYVRNFFFFFFVVWLIGVGEESRCNNFFSPSGISTPWLKPSGSYNPAARPRSKGDTRGCLVRLAERCLTTPTRTPTWRTCEVAQLRIRLKTRLRSEIALPQEVSKHAPTGNTSMGVGAWAYTRRANSNVCLLQD